MGREKNVAAIILAAGSSSRAPGFKPLLPLGNGTVIGAVIDIFRGAGLDNIVVVTGYRSSGLEPVLDRMQVRHVLNERYDDGMFSSIVAGVKAIDPATDAFFLLPADMPLVRHGTVTALRRAYGPGNIDVVYPVYQGRKGHPPLISGRCIGDILTWNRPEGLRTLLQQYEARSLTVDVADDGILLDIDTAEDYQIIADRFARRGFP